MSWRRDTLVTLPQPLAASSGEGSSLLATCGLRRKAEEAAAGA